ncbi:hypothetical protein BJ165DRAFT_1521382 [Panaeolus papilionaceus]|nr:hypothetical protein BJ165DRAFT_1521382 [Panaeolus papilionaceus]
MLLTKRFLCSLLLLVNNVLAVPQSPTTQSSSDSDDDDLLLTSSRTTTTSSTPSAPSKSPSITRIPHPRPFTTHKASQGILHSQSFTPPHPTFTQHPGPRPRPTGTDPPTHVPHRDRDRNSQPAQKPIAIVFEVLAGLVALAIAATIIRCIYNYSRAPKRDRIAEVLSRHQLQRELEELERNPLTLRREVSVRDPAPPYFPPPPAYTHNLPQPATLAPERPTDYTQIPTSTPPPSPPSPPHPLPPSPIHLSAPTTDPERSRSHVAPPIMSSSESQHILVSTSLTDLSPPSTTHTLEPLPSQPSG